ncbi:MAG TPA: NAD(P)/FAD-dependent oxidoreductase, partial [Nitrososphaerales archaeon]|nr:NAD(P)/FAD-dependent oxidoreductase [Nitrososphaerales archaeon]
ILVAGGSIAGLAFATEASAGGAKVIVAEEHQQIGEPEKCDGLVSLRGLRSYGYLPAREVVQNDIVSAVVHSPGDRHFAVNASTLEVVVLHRSAYDRQVASMAQSKGAKILTSSRVSEVDQTPGGVTAKVGGEKVSSKLFVDATGPSSSPRRGILPAAKYEVQADWVKQAVVEVFLDAEKYPGFFAWVIPYGRHLAKVGAAGVGMNPFSALDAFLSDRPCTILRKVSAPIYIGGPAKKFVHGRKLLVGESAGQVKPTTAGGIMTSIGGAVCAAKWAKKALAKDDPGLLDGYQPEWESRFAKEMNSMLRLRGVFEKMSNPDLEALVKALATPKLILKLSQSDFDFHATALLGALGVPGLLRVAKVVASAEIRSLLAQD